MTALRSSQRNAFHQDNVVSLSEMIESLRLQAEGQRTINNSADIDHLCNLRRRLRELEDERR